MSIFVTNLAFAGDPETVSSSKLAILVASFAAGSVGYLWLSRVARPVPVEGGRAT
jgi:NhaA family Na+:H+ antiporter